jgi:hypothetical protein
VFLAGGAGLLLLMNPAKKINAGVIIRIFRNFTPPMFFLELHSISEKRRPA